MSFFQGVDRMQLVSFKVSRLQGINFTSDTTFLLSASEFRTSSIKIQTKVLSKQHNIGNFYQNLHLKIKAW
jgi:hypothetical protein